jgi:hypothetical protein
MQDESSPPNRQKRPVRVAIDNLPLRIAGAPGHLVNISATGALARTSTPLFADERCILQMETGWDVVELAARVVRSGIATDMRARIDEQFVVALEFTELPPGARHTVEWLCGDAYAQVE